MALGGFGGGEEITLKVLLETAKASGDAKKFVEDFQAGLGKANKANAELNKAIREAGKEAVAAGKVVVTQFDSVASSARRAVGSVTELNSTIQLGTLAGNAIVGVFKQIPALLERAAVVDGVTKGFENLQRAAGELGSKTLQQLRVNTRGLISDFELMQKTNQALLLGLPNDKFVELTADAIKLGKAMGIDASQAVESLTLGIGRQSRLILDNLGIVVSAEQAYQAYADANGRLASELTDTEKKLAFQEAAFEAIKNKANELPDTIESASDAYRRFKTELENQGKAAAEAADKNGFLKFGIESVNSAISDSGITSSIADLGSTITGLGLAAIGAAGNLLKFGNNASQIAAVTQELKRLQDQQTAAFFSPITDAFTSLGSAFTSTKNQVVNGVKDLFVAAQEGAKTTTELGKDAFGFQALQEFSKQKADEVSAGVRGIFATFKAGKIDAAEATAQLEKFRQKVALSPKAVKDFGVIAKKALKDAEDGYKKGARESDRFAKQAQRDAKKLADEYERFARSVDEDFDLAVPERFVTLLNDALVRNVGNAKAAAEAIKAIGAEARKAGVEFSSIRDKAKELEKGIEVPSLLGGAEKPTKADKENIGSFFGQEFEGSAFEQSLATGIENAVLGGLQAAADAITNGTDISVRQLSSAVGTAIGGAIGAYFGGPAGAQAGAILGGVLGDLVGKTIERFNEDTSGTKARKSVDKFFADIFSADRLTVIVGNELERIKDFVVNANIKNTSNDSGSGTAIGAVGGIYTAAYGAIIGSQFGRGKPDSFADGTFDDALAAQQAQVQSFFAAVGTGFEELLGVSEAISGQVGAILFNNIGGNLVNLQAVLQTTGKSFEEFGEAMFQAFFNGSIGLQQLQDGLVKLSELFSVGIPGQIGAIDVAVQNLQISLQDDKGSRIIFNSLRSIGQEAIEAGKNLGQAAQSIAAGLGLGAEKVALFLEAMKLAGIKSVQDLVAASNAQLAALGSNILQITQGGTPTNATVAPPTTSITSAPNFNPVSASTGASRASSSANSAAKKAEEERKRRLEQLRNETERLVKSSDKYKSLLEKIGDDTERNNRVGRELRQLYDGQFKVLQRLQTAQEKYNKALEEGARGKKLGQLAKDLKDAQKAAEEFGKSLNKATKPDLTEIVKLITNVNVLGEVLNAVGVSADALKEVIVQGFKAGKLSIQEANDKLRETTELLGDGIPGKVGAVAEAFENLVKAGRQGGIFSINAFKDIFAEAIERFNALLGPERAAQLKQLRQNVDDANAALQDGIRSGKAPEEIDRLRKRLEGAVKAFDDFQSVIPKPELEDLRSELRKTFDPTEVDKFFEALSNSGITSIAEFQSASEETIIKILGDLNNLGFKFADQVDENTKKLLDAFNEQNIKLNEGKDILGEQLNVINQILGAAGALSPAFTSAGVAVKDGFDAPLNDIATQIGNVITQLAQFQQGTYEADVVLNVRTGARDSKTESLLELLFGDGSGSTIVDPGPGTSGLTTEEKKEFFRLRNLKKAGKKLSSADARRFAELDSRRIK